MFVNTFHKTTVNKNNCTYLSSSNKHPEDHELMESMLKSNIYMIEMACP